jgi:hypothetical protein
VKVVANGLAPVVAPLIVTVPIVVDPDTAAAKTAWVAVIVTPLRVTAQLAVLAPALVAVLDRYQINYPNMDLPFFIL